MSFINSPEHQGLVYAPGWFLKNNEDCTRETRQIAQSGATTAANGGKYVKMGTPYPSNDGNAIGLVYEDVDVSSGNMPGSVVTKGEVYEDRLPVSLNGSAKSALQGLGFKFTSSTPSVTRPDFSAHDLEEIGVASAAGTAAGDTAITISDYTPDASESYLYKTDSTAAPTVKYGQTPDYTWNAWDGSSDITATTGHYITIVSIDENGKAIAAGSDTVTAKA